MNDLPQIFAALKKLMQVYSPPLVSQLDDGSHFDLWSRKDLLVNNRKYKQFYFAGLVIQKSYVGFYYMPIYARPELGKVLAPALMKLLKGKSCFHVKQLDVDLQEHIRVALQIGFDGYQKNGWV